MTGMISTGFAVLMSITFIISDVIAFSQQFPKRALAPPPRYHNIPISLKIKIHVNDEPTKTYDDDDDTSHQQRYPTTTRRSTLKNILETTSILPMVAAASNTALVVLHPSPSMAKTGQIQTAQFASKSSATKATTSNPRIAFENLVKAREELSNAKRLLATKGIDSLRDYLTNDAENMNNFEGNALAILSSKMLDDEDKKAIGTIRRYGVGADVMIMYGGLMAEIDESNDDYNIPAVSKFLTRAMESLDEIITICKNNGF